MKTKDEFDPISAHSSHAHPVYIFDFDGTITTKDTFALFLVYYAGRLGWLWRIASLLHVFIGYKCGFLTRTDVKKKVIRRFFKNHPISQIDARAKAFATDIIPTLIRPAAQTRLNQLKNTPESLYICSASILPYLKHWGAAQGITNIMATELDSRDGYATGEILNRNVWGPGKIARINDQFLGKNVRVIEAYGDSRGDLEMLDAAEVSYWNPFRLKPI